MPASEKFYINFNSLPSGSIVQNKGNNSCTICIEAFHPKECVRQLHCQHYFHDACLRDSLKYNHQCPNCRSNIFELPKFATNPKFEYSVVQPNADDLAANDVWYCFDFNGQNVLQVDPVPDLYFNSTVNSDVDSGSESGSESYPDSTSDSYPDSDSDSDSDDDYSWPEQTQKRKSCKYCYKQNKSRIHKFFCKLRKRYLPKKSFLRSKK